MKKPNHVTEIIWQQHLQWMNVVDTQRTENLKRLYRERQRMLDRSSIDKTKTSK